MIPEKIRIKILQRAPQSVLGHQAWEVFLSALTFLSGLTVLGTDKAAPSAEEVLPIGFYHLWGFMLTVGAALVLAGIYIVTKKSGRRRRTIGRIIERAGLTGLGGASAVYAGTIIKFNLAQGNGIPPSAFLTFAFAALCFWQVFLYTTEEHLMESIEQAWKYEDIE